MRILNGKFNYTSCMEISGKVDFLLFSSSRDLFVSRQLVYKYLGYFNQPVINNQLKIYAL
jgi:hypothetical protein